MIGTCRRPAIKPWKSDEAELASHPIKISTIRSRYHLVLDPVLTEIKKLKSVRKQAHTGAFTREKILEKTRKYLVPRRLQPPAPFL
jgi:hypothetical protein